MERKDFKKVIRESEIMNNTTLHKSVKQEEELHNTT